ncbi:glutathione S-transferase family protein [Arhodomonas aquaeolei]|uniref:glutathione S-transferase family protein n=1 Tax=Arhodomonas aquaeolei TaxID=2369 RepID=UPI0003814D7A|nr:glutathione S-transferase [Arhodomonas aquaeolei]
MTTLHTYHGAPSPRRVHIYLAEKGLDVAMQEVDLRAGEQLGDDFLRVNPQGTVPVLELDDGTCIGDSNAICAYFEALHPEPSLTGTDARSQGVIRAWDRWVEFEGYFAVMEAFRNRLPGFRDHALPGPHPVPQIEALVERGTQRYRNFLADLDARLAERPFVAGDAFSIADITALVTVDFAARALEIPPDDTLPHVRQWHERVSARPSASA